MQRDKKGHFIKGHIGYKAMLGKKFTPEHILKLSLAKIGKLGNRFGTKCSEETKQKLSLYMTGLRLEEKNAAWKGNKVGYRALHDWVKYRLGKPNLCEHCGKTEAKRFEWANISHEYKRDLKDWARLCTSCHHLYDLNKLVLL